MPQSFLLSQQVNSSSIMHWALIEKALEINRVKIIYYFYQIKKRNLTVSTILPFPEFNITNHTVCCLLLLTSFSMVFEIQPCSCCISSSLFSTVEWYCMNVMKCFTHSPVNTYFHFLTLINNTFMNTDVKVLVWTYVFISCG